MKQMTIRINFPMLPEQLEKLHKAVLAAVEAEGLSDVVAVDEAAQLCGSPFSIADIEDSIVSLLDHSDIPEEELDALSVYFYSHLYRDLQDGQIRGGNDVLHTRLTLEAIERATQKLATPEQTFSGIKSLLSEVA